MRRQILEWCDRHKMDANLILARRWQDLKPVIAAKIEEIGWYEATVTHSGFLKEKINPMLIAGFQETVADIMARAQSDLQAVMDHRLNDIDAGDGADADDGFNERMAELFTSVAPLAGGLAVGAALPSVAVVSGTAVFGLVATSTVSVPILLGGLAVATGAIATGAFKTSQLRSKSAARTLKRVTKHVERSILSLERPDKAGDSTSVLLQIHDAIDAAVDAGLGQLK